MSGTYLSQDALTVLDELWAVPDMTLADITRRMQQRFGVKFSQDELREAARRNDIPVVRVPVAWPVLRRVAVPPDTQCVNRVPRGSCPVPAGGYRMGGAK